MAKIEIKHKCIMVAREAARKDSRSRETGNSVFIKRYYGSYRLLAVFVSESQRSCRDMFAAAQKMASRELKMWNKKRHWERMARKHKIRGAHRMAVSWFYGMLKESGGVMNEEMVKESGRCDGFVRRMVEPTLNESRLSWASRSMKSDGMVRRRKAVLGGLCYWEI